MSVGYLMSWTGRTRPWMWAGGVVNTVANGLLIMLDGRLPRAVEYVFLTLSGAGVGFIAQTNTVSAQSKVAKELLASVTTMTMWSKSLGGIIGIAMQRSIINNVFQKNMLADPAAAPVRLPRFSEPRIVANFSRDSTVRRPAEGAERPPLAATGYSRTRVALLRKSIQHHDDRHDTFRCSRAALLAHR